MCAQTSFYMIFNYYGDSHFPPPFFYDRKGAVIDLHETIPMIRAVPHTPKNAIKKITKKSKISKWINPFGGGTYWHLLRDGAENLFYKDPELKKYYTHVFSQDTSITNNKKGQDIKRNIFIDRILPFLEDGHPVIIHLKRKPPFTGHYLVVAGYDTDKKFVYYVDPNKKKADDVLQKVALENFICKKWYEGNAPKFWGKAEWDGKWFGFYRK